MLALLIFPHQLSPSHPLLKLQAPVFLLEEPLFFKQYPFHQKKLVLHRASMKAYEADLVAQGKQVHYLDAQDALSDVRQLIPELKARGFQALAWMDPCDDWLNRRLRTSAQKHGLQVQVQESDAFINTSAELEDYLSNKKKYFQTDFYIQQRRSRGVLLEGDKPLGGQWSFDPENRKAYPKKQALPALPIFERSSFLDEAEAYVRRHFPQHPGKAEGPYLFAIHPSEAMAQFEDFLQHRFRDFGPYEDAMPKEGLVLHHSLMASMLNIGLLKPMDLVQKAIAYGRQEDLPLASVEGFVRQLMGWREFIRMIYLKEGRRQRRQNFFGFHRPIPPSFWDGTTGLVPVDAVIKKVLQHGYCHHIERLMVLGNVMLLCEFDPDAVYEWFMALFIDAYDWVMVPNVYGMTQFADGGLMTTKPYISGSNYILKMSDYAKGPWQAVWDALFWRFLSLHRGVFERNMRMRMLLSTYDKMPNARKEEIQVLAQSFIENGQLI